MVCMKICVLTRPVAGRAELPPCDVALLGFGWLGDVDYSSELAGKSDKLGALARLTSGPARAAVCGCRTDSRGLRRKSAAVAECGRLAGISDMLHVVGGENYKSGATLGHYRLGGYRVGVCIENDMLFPENIGSLSLLGCDLLAFLSEEPSPMQATLLRAYAYLYGIPAVMCAGNCAYFADITGALLTSPRPETVFSLTPRNNFRVVTTRRRGCAADERRDY